MKTNVFRYVTILVLLLLLVSSCAPLPTPSSAPNQSSQSNSSPQSSSSSGNSSTSSNTNWKQFLTIMPEPFGVCNQRVLPIAVDPSGNVGEQISNTNPTSTIRQGWTVANIGSSSFLFQLTSSSAGDWIKISKSLDVNVSADSSIPRHTDVLNMPGCGGTGQIRDFSSIKLRTDLSSFSQKTNFTGADFFTLQPGEFEVFSVPFQCSAPGYYRVSITAEYSYQGENGVMEFPEFDILCPQSATVYTTYDGESIAGAENFDWKNGKYIQSP